MDGRACPSPCAWTPAIQRLQAAGVAGVDVQWVPDAEAADLVLQLRPAEVRFVATAGATDLPTESAGAVTLSAAPVPAGAGLADRADRISSAVHRIARARNLLRLASRLALSAADSGIAMTVHHLPAPGHPRQSITADAIAPVQGGDRLSVDLHNDSTSPSDVTLLWVDSQYGITCLFPDRRGDNNRIPAGETIAVGDIRIEGNVTRGRERLLLIALGARQHADRMDLSFLEQPTLALTRGGLQDAPAELMPFMDAGFAAYLTRGALLPESPTGATYMQMLSFDVRP